MFDVRCITSTYLHNCELLIHASMTSAFDTLGTTFVVCQKTPPSSNTLPPNGQSSFMTSFKRRLMHLRAFDDSIDALSMINKQVFLNF